MDDEQLPAEERARRERAREVGGGIVTYSANAAATHAVVVVAGAAHLVDVRSATTQRLDLPTPVLDPRLDRSGRRLAFVHDGAVWVHDLTGLASTSAVQITPRESSPTVTWGLAEFIAAEEMNRSRGHWWTHDGSAVVVTRVDTAPVQVWHITDPANPAAAPQEHHYPAAGTANAQVQLHIISMTGSSQQIMWDQTAFEYLATVRCDRHGVLLSVQSRDQQRYQVLASGDDGSTTVLTEVTDSAWVELVDGCPARLGDGALVLTADDAAVDHRRLMVSGQCVSPDGLDVRSVVSVADDAVWFTASPTTSARASTTCALYRWSAIDGTVTAAGPVEGWSTGQHRGGTTVLSTNQWSDVSGQLTVISGENTHLIGSHAQDPLLRPVVHLVDTDDLLRIAVVLPTGRSPHDGGPALPVLMDPYGGPHGQRVVAAAAAYLTAQWWADQGFAVVIADGHGMPGRPSWEKSVHGDLATLVLADQVRALHIAADHCGGVLDTTRVGIRGWSFGGYLAALAVLDEPSVFHCAVAGAPVTNWRLYDTHYTERYLGDPDKNPAAYEVTDLVPRAANLRRPLMLIHGLADDNVVAAHTLQLSAALTAAGRPHQVLPLSNVTHMTPQEEVAENLLLLQRDFLLSHLESTGTR